MTVIPSPSQPSPAPLQIYGRALPSRLFLGTALYPSLEVMAEAVRAAQPALLTVSLRRAQPNGNTASRFMDQVRALHVPLLPNTAGCASAREAVTTARMARELLDTDWIKLEVIGNPDTLHPDVFGLIEAARELARDGFHVLPYTTEDLSVAEKLLSVGCGVLMPWGAPIGTGRGFVNPYGLRSLRAYFPGVPLIVDAGLGAPSHAAQAMELGYDAVLLNTAVAEARDPARMAQAFAGAVIAGRLGYEAGLLTPRDMASPSTPVPGTPFFDLEPVARPAAAPRDPASEGA